MKKSEIIERINGIPAEKLNAAAHAIISSNPVNAITTNRAGYNTNGGTITAICFTSRATKENMMSVYHAILDEITVREGIAAAHEIDAEYTPAWYTEDAPKAEKAPATMFPNLTAAVNAHYDSENAKAADKLARITCREALDLWYYRERMTPAARRMVEESEPGDLIPEAARVKMLAKMTRENEKDRARYLAKLEAAEAAPDPEYITINMEWKRSSVWGSNPSVEITGERTRTAGSASGCGYDKASAATASAANVHPEILRILYTHAENGGTFPYSVYTFAGLPYFDGGCGMSCFYNVFEACGYHFRQTASGKTFDAYAITKGGENA